GCGGGGNAAVLSARLAGARQIIAEGNDPRKLERGRDFGATHVIKPREAGPETDQEAFYARDLAGPVVRVGVPPPEMRLDLPLLDFFGRGGALKSSWYGDCLPESDFPLLTDLYLQGRLPLEKFVSETIAL